MGAGRDGFWSVPDLFRPLGGILLAAQPSFTYLVIYNQRRMIRKSLVPVDGRLLSPGSYARGADLVIDTPTHILGPGLATIRPPGVLFFPIVQMAEYIDHPEVIK